MLHTRRLIIEQIKKSILKNYKIEVSNDNYTRYQGKGQLTDYYTLIGEQAIRDSSLIKNVSFLNKILILIIRLWMLSLSFAGISLSITLKACMTGF